MQGAEENWRQGTLLTAEDLSQLHIVCDDSSIDCAVIVSHDCDIRSPQEQYVEILLGKNITKTSSQNRGAKHPRLLHLTYVDESGEQFVAINHKHQMRIKNELFQNLTLETKNIQLRKREKSALKQWLSARYGRPAFPDTFEDRLRKTVGKKNIETLIAEIIAPISSLLVAVYFDLDVHRDNELNDGEPYLLSIHLIYDTTQSCENARQDVEKAAQAITMLMLENYGPPECATEIEFLKCDAIADLMFNLVSVRKMDQWRLEYLCFEDEEVGHMIATCALTH